MIPMLNFGSNDGSHDFRLAAPANCGKLKAALVVANHVPWLRVPSTFGCSPIVPWLPLAWNPANCQLIWQLELRWSLLQHHSLLQWRWHGTAAGTVWLPLAGCEHGSEADYPMKHWLDDIGVLCKYPLNKRGTLLGWYIVNDSTSDDPTWECHSQMFIHWWNARPLCRYWVPQKRQHEQLTGSRNVLNINVFEVPQF